MSARHYTGSCQCGAVTYAVEVDLDQTRTCNCSRSMCVDGTDGWRRSGSHGRYADAMRIDGIAVGG